MRKTSFALALLTAAVLSACGGSSPRGGDQTPATKFSAQVSFGDSLSDVGTYAVGTVKALGGGKFTINGDNTSISKDLTGKNWTEFVAAQLQLPAPCPAQTGLNGDASKGFNVPVTFNVNCLNYAQGGSRVTIPIGPNNAATGSAIGATTVPVVTQIANHLAKTGGKFSGTELVNVTAGGNDILFLLGQLSASAPLPAPPPVRRPLPCRWRPSWPQVRRTRPRPRNRSAWRSRRKRRAPAIPTPPSSRPPSPPPSWPAIPQPPSRASTVRWSPRPRPMPRPPARRRAPIT